MYELTAHHVKREFHLCRVLAMSGKGGIKVRTENISCHINKQEMSQPSGISGLQMWMRAPQTEIQLPLPTVIAEEPGEYTKQGKKKINKKRRRSKVNKETELAPDSWGAYERNEFSESRDLHLPIHRMLNSLTWYLIFDVQTDRSLCCKLVYSLTSPPASLEQFSQSYWETVSWAQES